MATVPPLPLSLSTARATFGQGPGSLNAMRRGAGIVPDYPANAGVPTGSPIALSQLVGASTVPPATVQLFNSSVDASSIGGNATARLQVGGSLIQSIRNANPPNTEYTWMLSGSTSSYEVRFTQLSGNAPSAGSAALNTWHNCGSVQLIQLIRTVVGTVSGSWLVEMRPAGGGATLASCTWSLEATRNSGP